MSFVDYAWIIPALPLVAFLLILAIFRPLDVAAQHRRHPERADDARQSAAPEGHAEPSAEHQAAAGPLEADHLAAHADVEENETPAATIGAWIGTIFMSAGFILSLLILFQFLGLFGLHPPTGNHEDIQLYNWFTFGGLKYAITFRVDTLTAVMLVVVTSVSALVQLYSIGYMHGEPGFSRFFIELSLFTLSMLILVLAANFLVLFIGWELVGLSSYLLIGFWYDRTDPPPAALKAFVTTRLGDFGFIIGILILFTSTGTFDFLQLNAATTHVDQFTITAAMILVFCGAVGKSAQFPLHVWLPDAMEGPTPVSALIHAATMVAAGVYLVARLFPIYAVVAGPQSLMVVGYVGGFTALFAATIALVQNDIKRVLAYSTVSQLGYMFVGLAVAGNNSVGIFHLFTHAFFKALLFLGSGSVIIGVHHVQDMRKMGGLAQRMPITAFTFLIATLSIAGIPPLAGFFSKDTIIGTAFDLGAANGAEGYILYGVTLFTAYLTAFYMFRLYYLTFGGRGAGWLGLAGTDAQYRGEHPAHETPWTMTVPLMILAVPAAFAGWWIFQFGTFLTGKPVAVGVFYDDWKTYVGVGVAVVGFFTAYAIYGARRGISPAWYSHVPGGTAVYTLLARKYYMDEIYLALIRWIVLGLSNLAAAFDARVIDGVVNGSARFVKGLGNVTKRSETGRVQNYAAIFFAGALILMIALFVSAALLGAK